MAVAAAVRPVEAYVEQLRALFPRGKAWPEARGPVWEQLLRSLAAELVRFDSRLNDLLEESDPRTTSEALEDWERVLGLPDACFPVGDDVTDRRQLVVALLLLEGGSSPEYFENLAAVFGRSVAVTEEFSFIAGLDGADSAIGDDQPFAWWIHAEATAASEFVVGDSGANDCILDFGDRLLECLIRRFKPAHTLAHHTYDATAAFQAL